MRMQKKKQLRKLKEYLLISIGALLVAVAVQVFFVPHGIAPGGVSGIGLVLNHLLPGLSVSSYVLLLNGALFLIAFRLLGGGFGFKTLYASFALSGMMWIIENVLRPGIVTEDLLLSTFVGILLLGTGLGMVFNQEASTGGTDILAKILHRYVHTPIGHAMAGIDFMVVGLVASTFGLERGLYAGLATILNGVVINKVVEGFNEKKQVFVFTTDPQRVRRFITQEVQRGVTLFKGEGGYSGDANHVLYSVLSTREFVQLKTYLRAELPEAFIAVSNVNEVLGQGFTLPKMLPLSPRTEPHSERSTP